MEMQQIRYFVALKRELNFTRAAVACNISQPALTRAIQALEGELGGPLFHRERSATHLSELGRMMAPYLESILAKSDQIRELTQAALQPPQSELKIGAMCTIGPAVLADFIQLFCANTQGTVLTIEDDRGGQIPEKLLKGEFDVGLFGIPGQLDERLHALPLFSERFVIVLPLNHRLAGSDAVRVRDLKGEPYVARAKCEMGTFADDLFREQGVEPLVVFRSERDEWVLGMIKAGLGWGFFPEYCAFPPDVAVRPLIEPAFSRTISLVTAREREHSPAVGAFVRTSRQHAWPGQVPKMA